MHPVEDFEATSSTQMHEGVPQGTPQCTAGMQPNTRKVAASSTYGCRNAAKEQQEREREEEEAAAQLHGAEGGATTPSLECGRCGRKCDGDDPRPTPYPHPQSHEP